VKAAHIKKRKRGIKRIEKAWSWTYTKGTLKEEEISFRKRGGRCEKGERGTGYRRESLLQEKWDIPREEEPRVWRTGRPVAEVVRRGGVRHENKIPRLRRNSNLGGGMTRSSSGRARSGKRGTEDVSGTRSLKY